MTGSGRTAIVVASHKIYPRMEECITGLLRIASQPKDVIIVDNGSGSIVEDWAKTKFKDVTLLSLCKNLFFCGGYNAGIQAAMGQKYEFALIVNADCVVINDDFLNVLEGAMDRKSDYVFLGPRVWETEEGGVQTTRLTFPSMTKSFFSWVPYRLNRKWLTAQDETEGPVDFLNGVCVLCRLEPLREIGLMDESFGGYVEDADWSYRASEKGWKSGYVPIDSVLHEQEAFGYEHESFKVFLLKRNTVYFFLKTAKPFSAAGYAAASVALATVRVLPSVLSGRGRKAGLFLCDLTLEYIRLFRERIRSGKNGFVVSLPLGIDRIKDRYQYSGLRS